MPKEYIERTEELILAVNAGARAIENTKRYHGAIYNRNVFANGHKEISYLQAARVLRSVDELPAADVVEVVRCRECALWHPCSSGKAGICRGKMIGVSKPDDFCSYGERRDNNAAD